MTLTHILDSERYPAEALIWRALCGASCFALDDEAGALEPPDFDFYLLGLGHEQASCIACRKTLTQILKKRSVVSAGG